MVYAVSAGEDEHRSDLTTFLERNQRFAAEYKGGLQLLPRFSTLILTCIDARVDPAHVLGLTLGDALVFRNAGARVTDDVELNLGILWTMLSRTAGENFRGISLVLVQHTDCGFERLANPEMADALSKRLGVERAKIDSLANVDHVQRIHEDIERLRKSPLVSKEIIVSGYVYHVEDGTMEKVVAPARLSGEDEEGNLD